MGNTTEAEKFNKLAIENAESILHSLVSQGAPTSDIDKMRRVLSDRKGNLAIVYLQQDRFVDAFCSNLCSLRTSEPHIFVDWW